MRIVLLAATAAAAFLGGCSGGKDGNSSMTGGNAAASAKMMTMAGVAPPMVIPAAVTNKDQALKVMKIRHDGMEALGKAMKTLHRGLDSSPPDINAIRAQTSAMAAGAARIPSLFPPGTGPEAGKTRAKPDVWQKQDLFIRKAKDFLAAAQAIDAAAKAGDVKKVMALHDDVDKTCDACHKPFRAPEH